MQWIFPFFVLPTGFMAIFPNTFSRFSVHFLKFYFDSLFLPFSLSEIALYNQFCFERASLIQELPVIPLNLWKNTPFSPRSFLFWNVMHVLNSWVIISSSFINLKAESNFIRKEICDEIEGFGDRRFFCFFSSFSPFLKYIFNSLQAAQICKWKKLHFAANFFLCCTQCHLTQQQKMESPF